MPEQEPQVTDEQVHEDSVSEDQDQQDQQRTFTPITSQEDLDRIISERLRRERAKFADYDDVKSRLSTLEQERTEALKRAEEANRRADESAREALRARIAADKGVPAEALVGATREELEASADKLLAWRESAAPRITPPTPGGFHSGASKQEDAVTTREKAAAALRALRNQ